MNRFLATLCAVLSLACWQAEATVLTITANTGFPATSVTGTTTSTTLSTTAGTFVGTPPNGTVVTGTGLAASAPWNYLTGCSGSVSTYSCTINGPADTPCASACTINLFYGYQIPSNWQNTGSTIEAVAAGGFGHLGTNSTTGGGGGGGGAYVKSNPTSGYSLVASGWYPYSVGPAYTSGTATTANTFFNGTALSGSSAGAAGGSPGAAGGTAGAGGLLGNSFCTGTSCVKQTGGSGGAGGSAVGGGGGGGAGGPNGVGTVGGAGAATTGGAGGQGDSTSGGTGGAGATSSTNCGNGNNGTEWGGGAGGAGGGGGGGAPSHAAGCTGGTYGAGGGGYYGTTAEVAGTQGGIWITYTPTASTAVCTMRTLGAGPC